MSTIDAADFQRTLLGWYDRHARALPWRIAPLSKQQPDPYHVWLSEIMLQQTTVATVKDYFLKFIARWPTVEVLAGADEGDILAAWAGLGYYARARNLIACAKQVTARGGFPDTEQGLIKLPGIGPYTAAAIAAIAFDRPSVVVDGNIERVMARLFAVETPLPAAKPELKRCAAQLTPAHRPGDYAQALMDLGATVCRPKSALCLTCPVRSFCTAADHDPERLPVKKKKMAKPDRRGTVWWLTHGDDVLLVTRPPRGLLGGMRALPASDFASTGDVDGGRPFVAEWTLLPETVTHVFTHFRLTLNVMTADLGRQVRPPGDWHPRLELNNVGLPTLFAKAARLALSHTKEPE